MLFANFSDELILNILNHLDINFLEKLRFLLFRVNCLSVTMAENLPKLKRCIKDTEQYVALNSVVKEAGAIQNCS
jgi:hypothetical protein